MKLPKRKSRKKKRTLKQRCRVVRDKRTHRKHKVCRPAHHHKKKRRRTRAKAAPVPKPHKHLPVPSAAAPPVAARLPKRAHMTPPTAPAPPARPAPKPKPSPKPNPAPAPVVFPPHDQIPDPGPPPPPPGTLTRRDAERLLWRAGFGPRPGDLDRLTGTDPEAAVHALTRPGGTATLSGAAPHDEDGNPIDPYNAWGHDHLWWLDRMVRSDQPLVERMALIWHDWFSTTNYDVNNPRLMLAQNELFREKGLGSFLDLATGVTCDPAMLVFLNGIDNRRQRPNENYARELMELFTLGADRGAYTETDVRELARALTGWRATWSDAEGAYVDFRFDQSRYDTGTKTLWAGTPYEQTGAFGWRDAVRLCLEHPLHRSFFVAKLWSSFIPTPPDAETQASLEALYWNSGFEIRPVVEAILLHPDFYAGAPLVKPPAVYTAGLLRLRERTIDTSIWTWLGGLADQQLFYPPNVAGWNDQGWLDTATIRGRWYLAYYALDPGYIDPWASPYSATETADEAVDAALAFWDRPALSDETLAELYRFAAALPTGLRSWELGPMRAERQNALRHLIATSPDFHTI